MWSTKKERFSYCKHLLAANTCIIVLYGIIDPLSSKTY